MKKYLLLLLIIFTIVITHPTKINSEVTPLNCPLITNPNPIIFLTTKIDFEWQVSKSDIDAKLAFYGNKGDLRYEIKKGSELLCEDTVPKHNNPNITQNIDTSLGNPLNFGCAKLAFPGVFTISMINKINKDLKPLVCNEQLFIVHDREVRCKAEVTFDGRGDEVDFTRKINITELQINLDSNVVRMVPDNNPNLAQIVLYANPGLYPYAVKNETVPWPNTLYSIGAHNAVIEFGNYGSSSSDFIKKGKCDTVLFDISPAGTPMPTPTLKPSLPTPTQISSPTPILPTATSTPIPSFCTGLPDTYCYNPACWSLPQCHDYITPVPPIDPQKLLLCYQLVTEPTANKKCLDCVIPPSGTPAGMYTAIGCLPTDPGSFVNKYLFTFGLGMAGVIGFILMLFGSFTIMTSQGDPQKITKGKEVIVSVLAGLILIIFSLMIIKIIGIDIFNIPGLGG